MFDDLKPVLFFVEPGSVYVEDLLVDLSSSFMVSPSYNIQFLFNNNTDSEILEGV